MGLRGFLRPRKSKAPPRRPSDSAQSEYQEGSGTSFKFIVTSIPKSYTSFSFSSRGGKGVADRISPHEGTRKDSNTCPGDEQPAFTNAASLQLDNSNGKPSPGADQACYSDNDELIPLTWGEWCSHCWGSPGQSKYDNQTSCTSMEEDDDDGTADSSKPSLSRLNTEIQFRSASLADRSDDDLVSDITSVPSEDTAASDEEEEDHEEEEDRQLHDC